MEDNYEIFLEAWNQVMLVGAMTFVVISLIFFFYHIFNLLTISDPKKKYDYINLNEIRIYWFSSLFLDVAVVCFLNTLAHDTVKLIYIWFGVRLFVTGCFGLIAGFVFNYTLKVYYPFRIEKKLRRLRFKPRKSPKTGNTMKLLSEEEEDAHLDAGMQAEEDVLSIDYDVWIDEETGETRIDKYTGRLIAEQCPSCNYQTLKVTQEELIRPPTMDESGEVLKRYTCTYCKHKLSKTITIAKIPQPQE